MGRGAAALARLARRPAEERKQAVAASASCPPPMQAPHAACASECSAGSFAASSTQLSHVVSPNNIQPQHQLLHSILRQLGAGKSSLSPMTRACGTVELSRCGRWEQRRHQRSCRTLLHA